MSFWPVIVRELRAEARNPVNFWQRVAAGAVLTVVFALILTSAGMDAAAAGKVLFARLHLAMLLLIAVLVPSMTSDCIARERREGTLGLLFLTPLSPVGLVLGKCLVRMVRALSIIAAVMPVMAIPFLLGGVTWVDLVSAFSIQLCFVLIALAAGLLASARSRSAMRSLVLAFVLMGLGLNVFVNLLEHLFIAQSGMAVSSFREPTLGFVLIACWSPWGTGTWGEMFAGGFFPGLQSVWLATLLEMLLLSGLLLAGCIGIAAWQVRRRWRDEGTSARVEKLNRTFCTPVVMTGVLKNWLRRKLERNPIGWLEQRRWTGRVVVWSWFAVMTSFYSYALVSSTMFVQLMHGVHSVVAWALTGAMMVTAAGSFRRERETGVMELLLVSPLDEWRIIFGRLRGIWGQFLPAAALFVVVWLQFINITPERFDAGVAPTLLTSFVCLPVIGLYFSLRCRHMVSSLVLSVVLGYVVPGLAPEVMRWGLSVIVGVPVRLSDDWRGAFWLLSQAGAAWWALMRLHGMLRWRRFGFERLVG